jgi:hypothetical protein
MACHSGVNIGNLMRDKQWTGISDDCFTAKTKYVYYANL